ncbi:MAG: hypothetical protein Q9165_003238 [Trypethelium subeluteriae]
MDESDKPAFHIRSVAIIGAGPSGVTAAKYLLAERWFHRIVIFEQRNNVGGIWNYTPDDDLAKAEAQAQTIPQTSPAAPLEKPVWRPRDVGNLFGSVGEKEATFASALYDDLESNIPKELMQYPDYPFNHDLELFPERKEVLNYLEDYAQDVRHLIRFQTQVLDVRKLSNDRWTVKSRELRSGQETDEQYDAVLVASGHFNVPYVPAIDGLEEWHKRHPESLSHSKFYRRPDDYKGKKVIVVGNSASGLDIGSQIATVCQIPLLVSQRSESYLSPGATPDKLELPEITRLDVDARAATFSNGHKEVGIDAILFCTGYFHSLPFLSSVQPPLISDGTRVHDLYQHVFWRQDPTLAFLALNQKVTPFPVAQAQAGVVSRVWSNRLRLPAKKDTEDWEAAVIRERGSGKMFHVLQYPNDARYINWLYGWAQSAHRREGLEREGQGKETPSWYPRQFWMRERFPTIRKAFRAVGGDRIHIKTVEQLGFDFDADCKAEGGEATGTAKSSL